MTRLFLCLSYLALGGFACDLPGSSGGSGSSALPSCVSECRASAAAGCLEEGFDCNDACTQQGRIGCDDEAEELYTCTLNGCGDVDDTCSSELSAVAACRRSAAPQDCVADCLDAQNRGCAVLGTGTCESLCSNAIAANCGDEVDTVLACIVDALDAGEDCVASQPPPSCEDEYGAVEDTCETLQN